MFVTTNEAICAQLADAVAVALEWGPCDQLCVAALVDLRERVFSIPSNFVGNALGFSTAVIPVASTLSSSAAVIRRAWQPFTARPLRCWFSALIYLWKIKSKTGFAPVDFDNLVVGG